MNINYSHWLRIAQNDRNNFVITLWPFLHFTFFVLNIWLGKQSSPSVVAVCQSSHILCYYCLLLLLVFYVYFLSSALLYMYVSYSVKGVFWLLKIMCKWFTCCKIIHLRMYNKPGSHAVSDQFVFCLCDIPYTKHVVLFPPSPWSVPYITH